MRQTDKQIDAYTVKYLHRLSCRQTNRQAYRQLDIQTKRHGECAEDRQAGRLTEGLSDRSRDKLADS